MKKSFISSLAKLLLLFLMPAGIMAQPIKVTLLGTGVPLPSIERFGPSTLVEAGGQKFLFDCGRGVTQRLWQLKIPLGQVNRLFLTHLHSDHVVGIPDFWLLGWMPGNYGQRTTELQVWGPEGTSDMMGYLKKAFAWDIRTRSGEENKKEAGIGLIVKDIEQGVVYEKEGVKITAFKVNHADFIRNAFGYRVDYAGHSVVISGDTNVSPNLVRFAKGADVVIHEVAAARQELLDKSPLAKQIMSFHTTPEDAGKVFDSIKPRLAVFTHIVLLTTDPAISAPPVESLVPRTRTTYAGPLEVGEDLMSIEIGDQVKVTRFKDANRNLLMMK